MEKFIQLKKDNILRVGIRDAQGNDTGEHLEFDFEDIELPGKIEAGLIKHEKNKQFYQQQMAILNKKEDKKEKGFLSWKQKEQLKILKQFCIEEEKALDLFIGKGGTKKMLNGRNYYYTMFDDIMEVLDPIFPLIEENMKNIESKIEKRYSNEEAEVLK